MVLAEVWFAGCFVPEILFGLVSRYLAVHNVGSSCQGSNEQ